MACIFCSIIAGEIPSDLVHQDDRIIVIRDINPQAPVHLLVIPRNHIPSLNEATEEHQELLGHMMLVCRGLAQKEGVTESGYRLVLNTGPDSGQLVPHIHLHLLGGRHLGRLG